MLGLTKYCHHCCILLLLLIIIIITFLLSQNSSTARYIIHNTSDILIQYNHHHLQLAPLRVRSTTGRQQPPKWSVLGQVDCFLVHDSPWESRSFCTVFIQVIRGCPGGLFQYTEGEEVKICLASTLSSIRVICSKIGLDAMPG